MARDFRPKAARVEASKQHEGKKAEGSVSRKPRASEHTSESRDSEQSSSEDDEAVLLQNIEALGGDKSELDLIRKGKGKSRALGDHDNDAEDPSLSNDVASFLKGLDYGGAGVSRPELAASTQKQRSKAAEVPAKSTSSQAEARANQKDAAIKTKAERSTKSAEAVKSVVQKEKKKRQQDVEKQMPNVNSTKVKDAQLDSPPLPPNKYGFLLEPTPTWHEVSLPALHLPMPGKHLQSDDVSSLQERGLRLLEKENATYADVNRSGKGMGPGMLSSSDAKFITELLAPGARGGTLSDRVAALTLLAQSSPVHNVNAMETLLTMAGKKGREESGRATRALADWLASGGGLSQRKLRYLRDHPATAALAQLAKEKDVSAKRQAIADTHLLLATFEDKLKKFYFQFLQLLESQSHDTLPFVRKQAVTQIYLLLKEKSEQEQNLLRLLVNKLGDTDRSVASKASTSLLNILNVHPAMKAVISNEITNLVLKPTSGVDGEGKTKFNSHARYYGILTLNQVMLTSKDEIIANRLVTLYFDLFENVLREMNTQANGREEVEDNGTAEVKKAAKQKQRWRDGKKGKKSQVTAGAEESKVILDADAKTMAAILTGVRRALPFARFEATIFEKHMTTLFRITYASTFNIAIQALQLIYQVSLSESAAPSGDTESKGHSVEDRFYRALYASLLDPRLATTSKQAMYLNLLFKAIKTDSDNRRVKAFVKRFVQTLVHGEPPWICGGLYLLGELMISAPGLKALLEEDEDDGEEHYVDAVEGNNMDGKETVAPVSAQRHSIQYDALKREPQYARAEMSCLWELTPLLSHFHPSVSLHAHQLLYGEKVTTTADLTLNTLAHFLDRFVYRNPKKNVAPSKGASIMQPAVNVNGSQAGLDSSGVVKLKGVGIRKDEYVNDERFWRKKAQEVPVDQLFFHKYFTQKLSRDGTAVSKVTEDVSDAAESIDGEGESGTERSEGDEDEEDSEDEREILEEMKRTMPKVAGDELMDESDIDIDDQDDVDIDMSDEDGEEGSLDSDDDSSEADFFDEDEDDLLPVDFDDDSVESEGESRGRKRAASTELEGEDDDEPTKTQSQKRREERKKRKAMPTFASVDDYKHMLGDSDEEGDD